MTNPPARNACTTLLLSPAARPGAAKLDAASRPQNAASAATVRLDRIAIVRLHKVDEREMRDASGAWRRFAASSALLRLISKTANESPLFPECVFGTEQ